jgi:hypothetical protein
VLAQFVKLHKYVSASAALGISNAAERKYRIRFFINTPLYSTDADYSYATKLCQGLGYVKLRIRHT